MHAKGALRRTAGVAAAAMVVTLSLTTVSRAVQTTTTPNAALVGYNLAGGGVSAIITPPAGQSVLVMGCCSTTGFRGVAHVALLRATNQFIEWVGQHSTGGANGGATTHGFGGANGLNIAELDFSGQVFLEVADATADGVSNGDRIRVRNTAGGGRFGNVTLVW